MDNLTHTLAGLALARAGLDRRSRFATAALVIGANLPDIDGLVYVFGSGTDGLSFRRGWTHGILAMAVLPLLLAGAMTLFGRWRDRRRPSPRGPVVPVALLAVAAVGIWSHPMLDLLNTYGVRLLMPFSRRWFYGDVLFILDPWLLLALGSGILLTAWRSRKRRASPPANERWISRPARFGLGAGLTYIVLMAASSRFGVGVVERSVQGAKAERTLVSPIFLDPFHRDVVRDLGDRYEEGSLTWGWEPRYTALALRSVGRGEPGVGAASRTRTGVDFLRWARFPRFQSQPAGDSLDVVITDLRYGGGADSWAAVVIRVKAGSP